MNETRKEYVVTIPLSLRVWAFDEADALRQASQNVGMSFAEVVHIPAIKEVRNAGVSREATAL